MKIPIEELLQDIKSDLLSVGTEASSKELNNLKNCDTLEEIVSFLEGIGFKKNEAYEFIIETCVEFE
jgi:hypothetical protein